MFSTDLILEAAVFSILVSAPNAMLVQINGGQYCKIWYQQGWVGYF